MLEEANAAPAAASSSSVPAAPASMSQQLALTNGEPSQSVAAVATPAAQSAVQPAVDSQPEGSAAMEAAEAAQVEASLAILANAHYNETLPSVLSPPEEASACKRPAGKSAVSVKKIMKRPAAAAMLASSPRKDLPEACGCIFVNWTQKKASGKDRSGEEDYSGLRLTS